VRSLPVPGHVGDGYAELALEPLALIGPPPPDERRGVNIPMNTGLVKNSAAESSAVAGVDVVPIVTRFIR
jgi:hypothetical protein